jgi:multiple sugar transport system substrate-binding protein
MKRKSPVLRLLVAPLVISLIAAACGGDDDDDAGDDAPAATDAPADDGDDGDDAPAETDPPADDGDDAPAETDPPADDGDAVEIRWFVGLGTGGNPEQIEAQEAVVEAFNASQDGIELVLEIVQNDVAYDTLSTQIASGSAPDIIGPVGIRGAHAFNGRWLDLQPLVDASGYDLSRWDTEQVDVWRTDEGLVGLPFAVFPAIMFYNKALFDEAGLPYPPQEFGANYGDGRPWDMDTLRDIGLFLTVDANGNDATSADFDADNIEQFGYVDQWTEPQRFATMFGAGSMTNDDGTPNVPDAWRDAFKWHYDGVWNEVFIPSAEYEGSDILAAGNPFDSGNVAMAHTHLWYTCCVAGVGEDWDIGVVPAYDGSQTAALHADVFRILNTSDHPEEAFEALTYLIGEGASDLLGAYGGMPADESLQADFFAGLDETYPQGVNWDVATASLAFPDIPSHEQDMPNFLKAQDRWGAFWSNLQSTPGLDVDAEIDTLLADLTGIYAEAG